MGSLIISLKTPLTDTINWVNWRHNYSVSRGLCSFSAHYAIKYYYSKSLIFQYFCESETKPLTPYFAHWSAGSGIEPRAPRRFTQFYAASSAFPQISEWFLPRCMECRRGLAMRILSVCPSATRVDCDKAVERSDQIYIPYERTFSLVFWEEEWLVRGGPFYLKYWVNRPPLEQNRRF